MSFKQQGQKGCGAVFLPLSITCTWLPGSAGNAGRGRAPHLRAKCNAVLGWQVPPPMRLLPFPLRRCPTHKTLQRRPQDEKWTGNGQSSAAGALTSLVFGVAGTSRRWQAGGLRLEGAPCSQQGSVSSGCKSPSGHLLHKSRLGHRWLVLHRNASSSARAAKAQPPGRARKVLRRSRLPSPPTSAGSKQL